MPCAPIPATLFAQLRTAAAHCELQSAAPGLPAGFPRLDDIVLLLQPVDPTGVGNDAHLADTLHRLAEKNFLTGTQTLGAAGLGPSLLRASHPHGLYADLTETGAASLSEALFTARSTQALVSARPKAHLPLSNFVDRGGRFTAEPIGRIVPHGLQLRWTGQLIAELDRF